MEDNIIISGTSQKKKYSKHCIHQQMCMCPKVLSTVKVTICFGARVNHGFPKGWSLLTLPQAAHCWLHTQAIPILLVALPCLVKFNWAKTLVFRFPENMVNHRLKYHSQLQMFTIILPLWNMNIRNWVGRPGPNLGPVPKPEDIWLKFFLVYHPSVGVIFSHSNKP